MIILHIDSSILGAQSVSRVLSAGIVARQLELHPGSRVIYRDLVADSVDHLSGAHMAVMSGAAPVGDLGPDLALGRAYIEDLFAADLIVIGAPMYNFSVSSQLKSWIDRSCVAGVTFKYGPTGPESLLPKGKKVFIASSRGGFYTGDSPAAAFDFQETYLRAVLGFLGLTDITIVRAEGLNISPEAKEAAFSKAKAEILTIGG